MFFDKSLSHKIVCMVIQVFRSVAEIKYEVMIRMGRLYDMPFRSFFNFRFDHLFSFHKIQYEY